MAKQTEKKKEESEDSPSIDLSKKLNDINFKNSQIKMVQDLQNENAKLKQMVGRKKGGGSNMPKIQGLQSLKGNLGRQFMKRGTDY